jgi:hypothetical protein
MSHWVIWCTAFFGLFNAAASLHSLARARWYRARYLAEQRSNGQLHEAIFHLRQHLEKAQGAAGNVLNTNSK